MQKVRRKGKNRSKIIEYSVHNRFLESTWNLLRRATGSTGKPASNSRYASRRAWRLRALFACEEGPLVGLVVDKGGIISKCRRVRSRIAAREKMACASKRSKTVIPLRASAKLRVP